MNNNSFSSTFPNVTINLTAMNSDECRNGYAGLQIVYSRYDSPCGDVIIGSTHRGICYLGYCDNGKYEKDEKSDAKSNHSADWAIQELVTRFPNADFTEGHSPHHDKGLAVLNDHNRPSSSALLSISIHMHGTPFQFDVWRTLLAISFGSLTTYGAIAALIGRPSAARAVGSAIGSNPISYIVPCHRVVRSSGKLGGYHWGSERKRAILANEL